MKSNDVYQTNPISDRHSNTDGVGNEEESSEGRQGIRKICVAILSRNLVGLVSGLFEILEHVGSYQ